jgi:pyrimidine deaminase RibD-like protein
LTDSQSDSKQATTSICFQTTPHRPITGKYLIIKNVISLGIMEEARGSHARVQAMQRAGRRLIRERSDAGLTPDACQRSIEPANLPEFSITSISS